MTTDCSLNYKFNTTSMHENSKLKPGRTCCVSTEIVSDIQNNFCTQHVLPMFCKKKSFWQRFACTGDIHTKAFVHGLYPFHNIVLCMSIYMTVILAMERYRAVSKPIDYHTIIVSGKQWQRVFRYVIPVVCFCLIFNLPKFFELTTKQENYGNFSRVSN